MKDIIHILPTNVANQIAAGEVVNRPASVVKELMENSLDAGATRIQVVLTDGGRTSIQVIDDGQGMTPADARLAFKRHATSKINDADDLYALSTMGFRGEALAAISSVAQVELRTRTADDELGICICNEGSHITNEEPVCCPVGANFTVRNLFYNTPGRRRFLKSNRVEQDHIMTEFDRIALAHPEVSFSLTSTDVVWKDLPAGSFRERIVDIFGRKLDEQLLKVETKADVVSLTGFVGSPETAKKKVPQQFFFVNGRYMQHGYFAKAVKTAFDRLVPEGYQVPFFLHLVVDPSKIDVNIHPTKTEIKFEDDHSIYAILLTAVRKALAGFQAIPDIEFFKESTPHLATATVEGVKNVCQLAASINSSSFNPFEGASHPSLQQKVPSTCVLHQDSPKPFAGGSVRVAEKVTPVEASQTTNDAFSAWDPLSIEYMQLEGRYLLAPVDSGLLFIDAHRAHYRILYEDFMKRAESSTPATQGLLFPQPLDLTPQQLAHFKMLKDELCALGFAFEVADGEYSVTGIPSEAAGLDPVRLVADILEDSLQQQELDEAAAEARVHILHRAASTLARRSAIPVGQHMSRDEMKHMTAQLFGTSNPNLTPDGKTIVNIMRSANIAARFN